MIRSSLLVAVVVVFDVIPTLFYFNFLHSVVSAFSLIRVIFVNWLASILH